MEKKFTRTIGKLTYNEQHTFFYGNINGMHVTINQVAMKDGTTAWLVKEELKLFEIEPKEQRQGGFNG